MPTPTTTRDLGQMAAPRLLPPVSSTQRPATRSGRRSKRRRHFVLPRIATLCSPARPVNSLDQDYGGSEASGPSHAGSSSLAGNVLSGSVTVPRVQQAPTVHDPTFYRAQTKKVWKRKGRDPSEGFRVDAQINLLCATAFLSCAERG
jgi:hypothetical protein